MSILSLKNEGTVVFCGETVTIRCITFITYAKTNLSAKKAQTRKNTRISLSGKNELRLRRDTPSPPFRPRAPRGLVFVFARTKRLPRAAFPAALLKGRRVSSEHFTVVFPETVQGYAVVISKKTARLSVTRHRIKRRVYAALRTLNLPKSLIVFPRSSADSVSFQDMKAELAELISKATRL